MTDSHILDSKVVTILVCLTFIITTFTLIQSDESDAVTDLGTYTGRENLSSPTAFYSGIDCDISSMYTDKPFYLSIGAVVRTTEQISTGEFWIDGLSQTSTQDLGLNDHYSFNDRTQMIDIGIDGTIDEYGYARFDLYHMSGTAVYEFYCIDASNEVTFDRGFLIDAGGDSSGLETSMSVSDGESAPLPDLGTTSDGFIHVGWLVDGTYRDAGYSITPTGSITVQSLWQVPTVTITLMVGTDYTYATLTVPIGSSGIVFTPKVTDGVFTGWFYDPDFTQEYIPYLPLEDDVTLYAKGVPPLTFTTDPVADGDIVALEGQPGTVSFRATDSLYYSSVLWDFGDGTTSTDLYATHYYSEPGTYTASLTVYNNHGSDVTTYRIEVPSADPGDDGTEWALVAAVVLIAFVSGALIARRLL